MSYPINYPTPTNANIQFFVGGPISTPEIRRSFSWVKPTGSSFIWFTLIGNGGAGAGGTGSGAVTNCLMPAFLVPDELQINIVGTTVGETNVTYYCPVSSTGYKLLIANGGNGATGGVASTSNYFSCAGLFQSVAGQDGGNGLDISISPSATTFLSAGAYATSTTVTVTANYGYAVSGAAGVTANGTFQISPIICGVGTVQGQSGGPERPAIGCGGRNVGGPGAVFIISW